MLVLVNLALVAGMLRASHRTAALERRVAESVEPVQDAPRAGRADVGAQARRPGATYPLRPRDDARAGARGGAGTRSVDPDRALDRLLLRADADEPQEAAIRDAFDRHFTDWDAARARGDDAGARAAWRSYCDELAPSLSEAAFRRVGCYEPPPPPDPASLVRAPSPEVQKILDRRAAPDPLDRTARAPH